MVKSRTNFPREGEFLVCKVTEVEKQYVYVDLIDYKGLPSEDSAKGMIHISEISSRWIKNIRSFVRIGQRLVLRVLRVDKEKGHIDLSLRRVNSAQKDIRMKEWKYALKFENLLQFLTETEGIDLTLDQAYELIGFPILDYFESYQEAVEGIKENGKELLSDLEEIPEDIQVAMLKIVDENVKISTVIISGKLKLSYTAGNGIDLIKDSLIEALKVIKSTETRSVNISYIVAPFYKLEVVSKNYLDAEDILSDVLETVEQKSNEYKGSFEFIRD